MRSPPVLVAVLAAACAVAACTIGAPTPTPAPSAAPTPAPTATPTATNTATSTVPPITLPTPGGTAAAPCATDSSGEPAVPPDAQLTAADGTNVLGSLGSYTYCGTSADALPPRSETLTTAALASPSTVGIQMLGGWGITGYRAGYWPATEWQGNETALGNATYAEPAIATRFDGPPSGDWMLAVNLAFPADGHAIYYWHLTVP